MTHNIFNQDLYLTVRGGGLCESPLQPQILIDRSDNRKVKNDSQIIFNFPTLN